MTAETITTARRRRRRPPVTLPGRAAAPITSTPQRRPTIAVIGAGFSGTLLALHLLRRAPQSARILLVERNAQFGLGLAYSTGNPNHLLNAAAGRMSAFSDRPLDFLEWLCARHVCLPLYPSLSEADADYVVESLAAALARKDLREVGRPGADPGGPVGRATSRV